MGKGLDNIRKCTASKDLVARHEMDMTRNTSIHVSERGRRDWRVDTLSLTKVRSLNGVRRWVTNSRR